MATRKTTENRDATDRIQGFIAGGKKAGSGEGGGGGGGTIPADKSSSTGNVFTDTFKKAQSLVHNTLSKDPVSAVTESLNKVKSNSDSIGSAQEKMQKEKERQVLSDSKTTGDDLHTDDSKKGDDTKKTSNSGKNKSSTSTSKSSTATDTTRSSYYGLRGDQAKLYQNWLNQNGNAGLTVDGIWGKNTEAAYQANKAAFDAWLGGSGSSAETAQPTRADMLAELLGAYNTDSNFRTDEQLRQAAEDQYNAQYNADVLAANQKNDAYQLSIQQQQDNLARTLAENSAQTEKQYEKYGNQLQRMLTARGMGRSSYAGDVAQNNYNNALEALAKLQSNYTTSSAQLAAQGAQYQQQTADKLAQLLSDKQSNVNNAYNQLYDTEYNRRQNYQSNYNGIISNLQGVLENRDQLTENQRQFDAQLKENQRQFNATLAAKK